MKGISSTSSIHRKKITQAEFYALYIETLDSEKYRPTIAKDQYFYLAKLLSDKNYLPDLSDLNLRNLNFTRTDFTGLDLEGTDFRRSICCFADFRGVVSFNIQMDMSTKLYGAQLTQTQLLECQLRHSEELPIEPAIFASFRALEIS